MPAPSDTTTISQPLVMKFAGEFAQRLEHRDKLCVCLSTQVGCMLTRSGMGCKFCASAQDDFIRNLTPAEITGQGYGVLADLRKEREDLTLDRIMFMGIGEPLLNYEALVESVRRFMRSKYLNRTRILVSTVGIVPRMCELAREGLPIELWISLHAPDDATRDHIVPMNRLYPIRDVMRAAEEYAHTRHQVVRVNYTLIRDVNDPLNHANQLATLMVYKPFRLQVANFNVWPGGHYLASSFSSTKRFIEVLRRRGIKAEYFQSKGRDVMAACGQLRRRYAALSCVPMTEVAR
jgi:23S rRNA (adenine2503-C2)-methyltransferase